jgi:glycogen synthase
MEEIVEGRSVGVAAHDVSDAALRQAVRRLLELKKDPELQQRCRQAALDLFSLGGGAAGYEAIYEALGA